MAKRRAPTDAERHLWNSAMRDVRKLVPLDAAPKGVIELPPPQPDPVAVLSRPSLSAATLAVKPMRPGPVDGATLDRLRRGQVNVDARIDLHGLDQRQAFGTLMRFIDDAAHARRRALLVITGKGASDTGGVLRRNVPLWVMASPWATRILTIVPAHNRHGGEGAFYIVLRHKRQ